MQFQNHLKLSPLVEPALQCPAGLTLLGSVYTFQGINLQMFYLVVLVNSA